MDTQNLTQKQIADACNVTQPTVQRWLNGAFPGGLEFYLLTKKLGCTAEFLLFEDAPSQHPQDTSSMDEIQQWKSRALTAEQELFNIQNTMRSLLAGRSPFKHSETNQQNNPPSKFAASQERAKKKALSNPL